MYFNHFGHHLGLHIATFIFHVNYIRLPLINQYMLIPVYVCFFFFFSIDELYDYTLIKQYIKSMLTIINHYQYQSILRLPLEVFGFLRHVQIHLQARSSRRAASYESCPAGARLDV